MKKGNEMKNKLLVVLVVLLSLIFTGCNMGQKDLNYEQLNSGETRTISSVRARAYDTNYIRLTWTSGAYDYDTYRVYRAEYDYSISDKKDQNYSYVGMISDNYSYADDSFSMNSGDVYIYKLENSTNTVFSNVVFID